VTEAVEVEESKLSRARQCDIRVRIASAKD
jgi:hypothetical protein